jgi:hypothetical protein
MDVQIWSMKILNNGGPNVDHCGNTRFYSIKESVPMAQGVSIGQKNTNPNNIATGSPKLLRLQISKE